MGVKRSWSRRLAELSIGRRISWIASPRRRKISVRYLMLLVVRKFLLKDVMRILTFVQNLSRRLLEVSVYS